MTLPVHPALAVRRAGVGLAALTGLLLAVLPTTAAIAAPAAVPGAPRSVSAAAGNAKATVTWQAPASTGGSAITHYTATCASSGAPTGTATVPGTTRNAAVAGLTNGATYTCKVTASNASGTGPASAASRSFVPVGPPTAPRAVTLKTKAGTLTVTWQAPSSTGGRPLTGYTVRCPSTDGGATLAGSVSGSVRSLALSGLPNNRTYSCSVTATGPAGTSPVAGSGYAMHASLAHGAEKVVAHLPVASGQSVSASVPATSLPTGCDVTLTTASPDASPLQYACIQPAAFVDGARVTGAGTATATLAGSSSSSGTAEILAYVFRDITGPTTIGGHGVTPTITSPGQNAGYSFAGHAGQQITGAFTGNTIPDGFVNILDPRDNDVGYVSLSGSSSGFMDTVTLPVTGTYTLQVNPEGTHTGHVTVTLANVPPNTGTLRIGTATTITVTTGGQNPTRTFSGTAGQQITGAFTGNTIPDGFVNILDPRDNDVGYVSLSGSSSGFMDTVTLPVTGTYTLQVNPDGTHTGHVTVTLANVPRNTGTIAKGTPTTVTLSVAGQNPTRTFHCTGGQSVSVSYGGNTIRSGYVNLLDPAGNSFGYVSLSSTSGSTGAETAPTTGTCVVEVDAGGRDTGHVTLTLH